MNVFNEFHKIVQRLQTEQVKYVVIGGVALAFHSQPRFTKDIDILTEETELEKIAEILAENGYLPSDGTLSFRSGLKMKRFWKVEDCDEMIVDVLMGTTPRHKKIITKALETYSKGTGMVRVATKDDLIWLKSQRNSPQDGVDISNLKSNGE